MTHVDLIGFTRVSSTYLYHFLFVIALAISLFLPITQKSEPVPASKKHIIFDKSKDPTYFTWASDLHIADHYPKAISNLKTFFQLTDTIFHPDNVIFSGDLVDNYERAKHPKKSFNHESHWQLYTSLRNSSEVPFENFFEVLGNHDTWGLLSLTHTSNYPDQYTNQPMFRPIITKEVKNVRLISFTPQEPPTGVGAQFFFPPLKRHYLDLLEEEVNKPTNAEATIIVTHYTTFSLYPQFKSSKGTSLTDLISSPKVSAYFAGHTHPKQFESWHHKSGLEIVSSHLKEIEGFAVVTVDNGRLGFTPFTFKDVKKAVITSPVDDRYATRIEPSNDFVIRILSFDPSTTLQYTVSGSVTGTLSFERTLKEGVNLYSMNAHVENGHHHIHICGPTELDCDFSIGVSTQSYKEKERIFIRPTGLIVLIVLFFVFTFAIGVGMFLPLEFLHNCNKWMDNRDSEKTHFLLAIFAGPIVTGNRLTHFPIWLRCIFAFFILWPLFLPSMLFNVEGSTGISWMYGYLIEGTAKDDIINLLYPGIYYAAPLSFFLFIMSLYVMKVRLIMIIDLIYWIILVFATIFTNFNLGNELAPHEEILQSFAAFIFPVIFLIIIVIYIVKKVQGSKNDEEEAEPDQDAKELSDADL